MDTNRIKYRFDDFTHQHYKVLLETAKSHYSFHTFNEESLKMEFRTIFWRHDVDFSVHEALNLAKAESEAGVKATYFLLLHSEFYNLFETSVKKMIMQIIGMGHKIGVHFDPIFYNITSEQELEKWLYFEKQILETIFDVKVGVFSFHNPTPEMLKFDGWSYSGMINTYAKGIKEQIAYCSDSNGHWRFKRLFDVLSIEKPERLQVLTHPEWWTEKVMSPKEKVWRCIDKRAEKNKLAYKHDIESHGRSIID